MMICTYNGSLSSGSVNSNISITNNTFSNFSVYAIYLKSSETSDTWTISGNSFYQTGSQTPVANVQVVSINSGSGHTITGNYIGGQAASCGGSAYTLATSAFGFYGIYFSSLFSGASANTISSNTISNLNITNSYSSPFFCILADGSSTFNIGSSGNGNVIGSTSGTGNITITTSYAGTCYPTMISNRSSGNTNTVSYNNIGSITINGTATNAYFDGIDILLSGSITVSYNTIGNSTSGNIIISSSGYGYIGIYSDATGNATITQNTIQNFNLSQTGSTTYAFGIYQPGSATNSITYNTIGNSNSNNMAAAVNAWVVGIYGSAGTNTISHNTIQQHQLTSTSSSAQFIGIYITSGCKNAQTISYNKVINITSSSTNTSTTALTGMCGIYFSGTTANSTIANNCISNLSITASGASTYSITGINIDSSSGTHTIKKNKCDGFDSAANSSTAINAGIYIQTGTTNLYNNVIILNNATNVGHSLKLIGIRYETTASSIIYHNTIKIYGTATSLSGNSSCLYNSAASTLTVKNNLFQNIRTNSGGTGKHYAINYSTSPGTLTEDYNYLEASGTGGYVGYYSAADRTTLANWQTATSKDAAAKNGAISVSSSTGVVAGATTSDVKTTGTNASNAAVSDDFDGNTRSNTGSGAPNGPWMGAYESATALPIKLLSFTGQKLGENNELKWTTATEINNAFFTIEKTTDGNHYTVVGTVNGAGNSIAQIDYILTDYKVDKTLNYYRLLQTDYDGQSEFSDIIEIDNRINGTIKEISGRYNILGEEVNELYHGVIIITYTDGTSIKIIQ